MIYIGIILCFFGKKKDFQDFTSIIITGLAIYNFSEFIPLLISKDFKLINFSSKIIVFVTPLLLSVLIAIFINKFYAKLVIFILGFGAGSWIGMIIYSTLLVLILPDSIVTTNPNLPL